MGYDMSCRLSAPTGKATAKSRVAYGVLKMGQANNKANAPTKSFITIVFDRLASVKFAVTVVVVIAIACITGTLIPQGTDVAKCIRQNPDAADRLELFGKLGLTHVFYS